jgi:hypothetical protein
MIKFWCFIELFLRFPRPILSLSLIKLVAGISGRALGFVKSVKDTQQSALLGYELPIP